MGFLDALRKRRVGTPGFAGGTLEEQLEQEQQRPRTVAPLPSEIVADPNATRQRAVTFDQQTGKPNEDFYRERNDLAGLYDATQNWKPRGAKRGFKNSLKAGAMMAAEAVRNNPRDPVTAAITGFGIGTAGATAAPNFKNRLGRQWQLNQVGGELERDLELKKTQAQIDMGQMTPVTLDNGSEVMVPARSAGALQSQQQRIKQSGDVLTERKRSNDQRKTRWDAMEKRDRMRNIIALYNSGGLNDPDLLEYAADQLALPGPLREKFIAGRMRDAFDQDGNLIQVNRQTNEVTPVLTPEGKPQGSIQGTLEQGRNRRAAASQAGQNQRAAARATGAAAKPKVDATAQRRAAQLTGVIESARKKLEAYDARTLAGERNETARKRIADEAAAAITELNNLGAGYEAGMGQGGYPYHKKLGGPSDLDQPIYGKPTGGRTIEGAIAAFEKSQKRKPTADEIARMMQALGQQ